MRGLRNPFRLRRSESIDNEDAFLMLFEPGILDVMPVHITPDGQTYAYGYRRYLSDLFVVTGLR